MRLNGSTLPMKRGLTFGRILLNDRCSTALRFGIATEADNAESLTTLAVEPKSEVGTYQRGSRMATKQGEIYERLEIIHKIVLDVLAAINQEIGARKNFEFVIKEPHFSSGVWHPPKELTES